MANGAKNRLFWGVVSSVVVADLITKQLAVTFLSRVPRPVVGDFLQLHLVYNPGAAFGLNVGVHSRWVFMVLALVALVILLSMVKQTPENHRFRLISLSLISGGAIGNLIDRIRSARGVIDFIDVGIGTLRWPTFNVADMAVTCGAVALALILWQEGRESDSSPAESRDTAEASSS